MIQNLLLLFTILLQAFSQNVRTLFLHKVNDMKYQCIDAGCSVSTIVYTSNVESCQFVCLSDNNCQTITFDQSNNQCEVFSNNPYQYGNMLTQTGVQTMTVADNQEILNSK